MGSSWLMKAEPDSRIVKGKDVKFSVDDFEKIGTSPWDGVRNHEAKKIMKEKMKLGDKQYQNARSVNLHHATNESIGGLMGIGIFALAEIAKEGYPDYTAWDESHPYFDAKTDQSNPTWYMVNVKFVQRLEHPPTLVLIKHLATLSTLPESISYIGEKGLEALKGMVLVNRGRLSVQPVSEEAYEAIVQLGTKGGWEDVLPQKSQGKTKAKVDVKVEEKPAQDDSTAAPLSAKPVAPVRKKRSSRAIKEESSELSEPEVKVEKPSSVDSKRRSKRSRK